MRLRPRYSLLTLLVLTALVAGGVKLWYGPHHVVERTKPDEEVEYTYTRDWQGKQIINGPLYRRYFKDRVLYHVVLEYYQSGIDTYQRHWIYVDNKNMKFNPVIQPLDPFRTRIVRELPPQEPAEFQAAIEREHTALQKQGFQMELNVPRLNIEDLMKSKG